MLSPALETHQGNRIVIGIIAGLTLLIAVPLAPDDLMGAPLEEWAPFLVVLGLAGPLLFWLSTVRVSLHPEGITRRSCFGEEEMRWEEVERFHYTVTRQSVNFIPVGTYYDIRLIDGTGRKIKLGNSVNHVGKIGEKLIQATSPVLFRKLAERYNRGEELDFGAIKLHRERGIRIKKTFREKHIPLDQVAEYRIEQGHVYIFKVGDKRIFGTPIGQVPNAFVLIALLDSLYGPPA